MRRSLVTGGHGFIASHLTRALVERGDRVTVIDRARPEPGRSGLELQGVAGQVELVTLDLAESDALAGLLTGREHFDSVFHLAAQTLVGPAMADPTQTFADNVAGTWQLLEACRGAEVGAVVVASSDKAYGPSPELPYQENQRLAPAAPYEASKAAAEKIARAYARAYGMPLAVTRFANVYGGGDLNRSRLIPELIRATLAGERPQIRSDGSPERDYLYIDDAVTAYLAIEDLARRTGPGEEDAAADEIAYNAGSGRASSVRQVIAALASATGQQLDCDFLAEGVPDGEIDCQWVDASRLTAASGWRARVDLEEGLKRTFAWYAQRPGLI